jgi:hypothetical protein
MKYAGDLFFFLCVFERECGGRECDDRNCRTEFAAFAGREKEREVVVEGNEKNFLFSRFRLGSWIRNDQKGLFS